MHVPLRGGHNGNTSWIWPQSRNKHFQSVVLNRTFTLLPFRWKFSEVKKNLKDSNRAGLSIRILLTSIALSTTIPQIIFYMLNVHPGGQWIFIHITEFGSVQHTWQSLVKKSQKLEQQKGHRSRLAYWQSAVRKSVQCLSMLYCALMLSVLYFHEYKNHPQCQIYVLCVNVCITLDRRSLVECQILKFLCSPSEGIIYKARCQLLQLFFMAFHRAFFC